MPHHVAFVPDVEVVVVRFSDEVTMPEIEEVMDEIPAQPWFRPHLKMIGDLRGCTTDMTGQDVQSLATYARCLDPVWGETKWAILTSSDVIYGLSRMYMALTSDYQVHTHVFRTIKEANDWLELGVDMEEALRRAA